MSLFELILSPFFLFVKHTFIACYNLTGNYGISILLLSFIVSALLLPVFALIEKSKKKDDAVKQKMQPLIDEIKRCYKGQERHYYLKTLNRQHNFSPAKSLIPILSLLIQIPFFIAAYQFLEVYEPLVCKSFLFIKDLAEPDSLFGSINLLPIVMTVVNLITAYFYTRNGNVQERKQMLVVATIFLILLFKLPAALVLYWTMNNLFSFFRLFITNKEVFHEPLYLKRKIKSAIKVFKGRIYPGLNKLKISFFIIAVVLLIINTNNAIGKDFNSFLNGTIDAIILSFGIILSIALLSGIHNINAIEIRNFKKESLKVLWPSFKLFFLLLFSATVLSQINWALQYNFNSIVQRVLFCLVGSTISTFFLAIIVLFYQEKLKLYKGKLTLNICKSILLKTIFYILITIATLTQVLLAVLGSFKNFPINTFTVIVLIWLFTLVYINRHELISIQKGLINKIAAYRVSNRVYFIFLFASLYFYVSNLYYFTGTEITLQAIAIGLTLIVQLLGLKRFVRNRSSKKVSFILFFSIILIQFGFSFLNLNNNKVIVSAIFIPGFVYAAFILIASTLKNKNFKLPGKHIQWVVYSLSIIYILSLIFFWSPIIVYSSFPEIFSFPAIDIFTKNALPFLVILSSSILLFALVPKRAKFLLSLLSMALVVLFFVNSFINPIDVGTLQLGKYIEAKNMAMSPLVYMGEYVFIVITLLVLFKLYRTKYIKQLIYIISAILIILITQSLQIGLSKGEFFEKTDKALNLPSNISFSKTEPNVLFFIPDMFMGMHIKYLIEEDSSLMKKLDGFTWFPNTLSVSTNTCPAISSILAGHQHNLNELNKDRTKTMIEKITDASVIFSNRVKENNYALTSTQMVYSTIDKNIYDSYLPNWHADWNKHNETLNIGGAKELDFAILWKNALFYGLPLALKPAIYKNGNWIKIEKETNKNTSLSQRYNFIRLLPHISDTQNTKGNFVYIHSEATHGPWSIVNDNGELIRNVSSYENQKWFLHEFLKWVDWMKANDVYDNTKIILVSDHSHFLPDSLLSTFGNEFNWDNKGICNVSAKDFWRVNALLLVKDFNSKGRLKEDWRFMSNADASEIAFDSINISNTSEIKSRKLPVFFLNNKPVYTKRTKLDLGNNYWVRDSVFDANNWKKMK